MAVYTYPPAYLHVSGNPDVYVIDTATGRCSAHRVNGDTGEDEWDGMGRAEPAGK